MTDNLTDNPTAHDIGIMIGDYFISVWGYDQTNIDWYQVVDVTRSGLSVKVRKCETVPTGLDRDAGIRHEVQVMPGRQIMEAGVQTRRLKFWLDHPKPWQDDRPPQWHAHFKVTSYADANWQGHAVFPTAYQTAAGYGH